MSDSQRVKLSLAVLAVAVISAHAAGQPRAIDAGNSRITIHVAKAGLFSALGDNHEVAAPIAAGAVDQDARRVRLVIEASRLEVLDPQLSPEKRRQVQERMLGPDVLDVKRFPQISFESTKVEGAGPGPLVVQGRLSLHGQTRLVTATLRKDGERYLGSCTIRQREFGITPVSVAGGTVKVKDELRIDFDIRLRAE